MDPYKQCKDRAFISYSHSDEEWAKWLYESLETYRMPKRLIERELADPPVIQATLMDTMSTAYTSLAYILFENGDYADAACKLTTAGMPTGSWQIAMAMNLQGAAIVRRGHYREAEPFLIDSHKVLANSSLPFLADKWRLRLIELCQRRGKPETVQKLRSAAL